MSFCTHSVWSLWFYRWLRIASRELASYSITSPTLTANLCRPTVLRHAGEFLSPPPPVAQNPSAAACTPLSQPLLQSLLTPPYSDEKRLYHVDDEELAVPLPHEDTWHTPCYSPEMLH